MADVAVSQICSSLDPSHTCACTGEHCGLSHDAQRACRQATFLAKVSLPPDEFHILLDAAGRPSFGTLRIKSCREWQTHRGAGVHVNSILTHGPTQALVQLDHHSDGGIECRCEASEAAVIWRNGKFAPG